MKLKSMFKQRIPKWLWAHCRKNAIILKHQLVSKRLEYLVVSCNHGTIDDWKPKKIVQFPAKSKIIWQYWAQGFDSPSIPFIVRKCLCSVEKFAADCVLIRLSNDNIKQYLEIPDWLIEKRKVMSPAHFADVLRCMLLDTYGGLWLDAAVLLTGPIPDNIFKQELFLYQRDPEEPNKEYWASTFAYYFSWDKRFRVNVLIGIMACQPGNIVIHDMCKMLMAFWKDNTTVPDYFFFQILFDIYIKCHPERNCPIANDCIPHMLRQIINSSNDSLPPCHDISDVLKITSIHSLNYKNDISDDKLTQILNEIGLHV